MRGAREVPADAGAGREAARGRLRVAILGATGSIGTQALEVLDRFPDRFEVVGLAAGRRPISRTARHLVWGGGTEAAARILEMVTDPDCDLVLVAIPGAQALEPTLAALRAGKKVALATKEVLVMAGELVLRAAASPDAIRPVDSEHSAIWQCLWGEDPGAVARLVLTASGGPLWARPDLDPGRLTVAQAVNHPRWSMGRKVSVDSATLMNKGLELIEAHHLFGVPLQQIEALIHPQSVVHSLVEFVDGSVKAQLGRPDMRLPIALGLSYPDRLPGVVGRSSLADVEDLEFHTLDPVRFPAVALAREAARLGGGHPAVLNAANEVAVAGFLAGALPFAAIVTCVQGALDAFAGPGGSLPEILAADGFARDYVRRRMGKVRW